MKPREAQDAGHQPRTKQVASGRVRNLRGATEAVEQIRATSVEYKARG